MIFDIQPEFPMASRQFFITRIISGGQTGADRAALNIGLQLGIPIGGWCPQGRWAEDGIIDGRYPLQETPRRNPTQRTTWNVRDSDGTFILTWGTPTGGTALTIRMAERFKKPYLISNLEDQPFPESAIRWIRQQAVYHLNIAGPRESSHPGTYARVAELLLSLFTHPSLQDGD